MLLLMPRASKAGIAFIAMKITPLSVIKNTLSTRIPCKSGITVNASNAWLLDTGALTAPDVTDVADQFMTL